MRCSKIAKKLLPGTPAPEESISYIFQTGGNFWAILYILYT